MKKGWKTFPPRTLTLLDLQMNYYAWKMRAPRFQSFLHQMNNWHQWQLKKIKIMEAVLELPAIQHSQSSQFTSKMGRIGRQVAPKRHPEILIFFNCYGCQSFILADIHCYLSGTLKSWNNNLLLSSVDWSLG